MQTLQPLGNEEDILKEAQSAPAPVAPVPSATPAPVPISTQPQTTVVPSQSVATQPADAINGDPVDFVPAQKQTISPVASAAIEPVDLKPFHYALPVQNYIIAAAAFALGGISAATLIYTYVLRANARQLANEMGAVATTTSSADLGNSLMSWAVIAVVIMFGVSLTKNTAGMRNVSLVLASIGVLYWGYQLVNFIKAGGFSLMGSMFGSLIMMSFVSIIIPLGVLGYAIFHLTRPHVKAAYR